MIDIRIDIHIFVIDKINHSNGIDSQYFVKHTKNFNSNENIMHTALPTKDETVKTT